MDFWEVGLDLWTAAVLEVTESLDNQLAGRHLRGEVWLLSRPTGGKTGQVVGLYSETLDQAEVRVAFSVVQILERFYHVSGIALGVPNPIPRQVFLEPCEGVAPKLLTELSTPFPADQEVTAEQRAAFRKQLQDAAKGSKSANATSSRTNGSSNGSSNGKGAHQ